MNTIMKTKIKANWASANSTEYLYMVYIYLWLIHNELITIIMEEKMNGKKNF